MPDQLVVKWTEFGGNGFLVLGQKDCRGVWQFIRRSTWETVWYTVDATPQRVMKAEQLCEAPHLEPMLESEEPAVSLAA